MEEQYDFDVYNFLIKKGLPPHFKGFKYIYDAITCFTTDFDTDNLYERIANKNNTTPVCVKRCIQHVKKHVNMSSVVNLQYILNLKMEYLASKKAL